jgi:peroxin-4
MADKLRKRLLKEVENKEGAAGVSLRPLTEDLMEWEAVLTPQAPSLYEGAQFTVHIRIPPSYPFQPPVPRFETPVVHPNIHARTGEVCLDVLKSEWSPSWNLQAVCLAILVLLDAPDSSSPLNCDAGNILRSGDMRAYSSLVRSFTKLYATPSAGAGAS